MKNKLFSAFLLMAVAIASLTFWTPRQLAKENNSVSNLALMLPESDIILAIDVDKTLNVAGPGLLSQDAKKIDNLKKLMKSLENVIGINPYEINQVVAGVKLPSVEEKDFLDNIDFTVIFRTAHSNNALLEDWSKKIDAIEVFNVEKEPTEKYMDAFKRFRYYKLSKDETEKVTKLSKEFDEILKKTNEASILLSEVPKSAQASKLYKDSVKKNKVIIDSINNYQTLLKKDADVKSFRDDSIKLQNRWYEISLDDPKRVDKLAIILKEAKEIYPGYKTKVENLTKIDALINISNYQFYKELAKKSFSLPDADEYEKAPNDMMKEKLDEVIKTLNDLSTAKAKQTTQLKLVAKNFQRLEDTMTIRLKESDTTEKFDEILPAETTETKPPKSLSKSIKENARISQINGKMMISIDLDKISFWNPSFEPEEPPKDNKETEDKVKPEITKDTPKEVKTEAPPIKADPVKKETPDKHKKDEPAKPEKKKDLFAIGYLDDRTMVIGFETGIKSILNRQGDYKNPKAAEMLSSFKNPLVSFATNSKIFQNFTKVFEPPTAKKEEKKVTPTDKFFNDINIFGSIEYDEDNPAASDVVMSLGFTKNKVEEIFKADEAEEDSTVFELGEYQFSKAIFYDLLNTLKAFKASVSFKFEKKKVAALIESAPQIIEEIKSSKTKQPDKSEKIAKTKVQNIQNIEDILTSPKFYTDLIGTFTKRK